jgi:dienelactone hydrolase
MRTIGLLGTVAATAALALTPMAEGESLVRTEILPIDSVTLTQQEFLTGSTAGRPTRIAGQLTIPRAPGQVSAIPPKPAVVMLHGGSGIRSNMPRWASELNGLGIAVFIVDSFGGRGVTETSTSFGLANENLIVDAYRALTLLGRHPSIDREHIAVMGFSKGGSAALYSGLARFQRLHGPPDLTFAAHVALYPSCQWRYLDDEQTTNRPIRIFHGEADDWTPIAFCRRYVERLQKAGRDAALVAYPGAYHAFDAHLAPPKVWLPTVLRGPTCDLRERADGVIIVGESGPPFSLTHPCVERGATIGYNPEAHRRALADVTSFLRAVLHPHE